jgi:hypothetical protein
MIVYFHPVPGGDRDGAWAFLQKPLFARCPTSWYCQETRVLGRLVDATPSAFKPEFREDVRRFDGHMKKSLENLFARRDFNRGRDGYGIFNFGDHINYVEEDRRDKAGEIPGGPDTHWDNNYYRFPHLMFLQFLRTGEAGYFDMAMECQQHHADIDTLCWPENVAGAARYSAGPDHIRQVDEHLRCAGIYVSDSFNHFKNEHHFDRYYLTGDRGAWDVGMRSARFALAMGTKGISQNRSTGHGAFALLAGYQATGDKKYLEAARELAMGQGKANTIGLGIAADGARSYYEVTGDAEARARAVGIAKEMMASAKINRHPIEGDGVQAAAFAYGCNGDEDRLEAALKGLRALADGGPAQDVHGFALGHSGSLYALWFLTDKAREEK